MIRHLLQRLGLAGTGEADGARIVTGIVAPTGAGGVGSMDGKWSLTFQLSVWQEADGEIETAPLRIEMPVANHSMLELWIKRIRAREPVRIRVVDMETPPQIMRTVRMTKLVSRPHSPELLKAAEPILNPPPYSHPTLGTFIPDQIFPDTYSGQGEWVGAAVKFHLETEGATPDEMAASLSAYLDRQVSIDAELREGIIADLYPLWRDVWRGDREMLGEESWIEMIGPVDVSVDTEGCLGIVFDDGDLFGGHAITTTMAPDGSIEEAMLAG